jgi:hypothetical protein
LHQQLVDHFIGKANQILPSIPTIPNVQIRELRARLILEEALETVKALGFAARAKVFETKTEIELEPMLEPDLVEIADGCWDMKVVTTGTLSACGIADEKGQLLVDENNLAKFQHICPRCGSGNSLEHQPMHDGPADIARGMVRCQDCGSNYLSGYRREDGKWVKSPHHKPPDIRALLIEQGWNGGKK